MIFAMSRCSDDNERDIRIRRATLEDFDSILGIIHECKHEMIAKGQQQWPDHHPSREAVFEGISSGQHFVAVVMEKVLGGILLNHSCDEQYRSVGWRFPDPCPMIAHRLAVSPQYGGRGVGTRLMLFAEEFARSRGSLSIRLDTYGGNSRSRRFYDKLGFLEAGAIQMPHYMPGDYICYEKSVCGDRPND